MVNHIRTLLLNSPFKQSEQRLHGYIYIPSSFIPVRLPDWASTFYSLLFGQRSTVLTRLADTAVLMQLLHSTEYSSYVYSFDPRVTYSVFDLTSISSGGNITGAVSLLDALDSTPALASIFNTVLTEPYKTFFELWKSQTLGIQYKLSGVILAYCYKLEELRNARI